MNEDLNVIARMRAVTLSREYGSGGGEIASRLATRLGWRLVDHEIVVQIARELDISEDEAEAQDEYAEGTVSHILASMRMIYPAMFAVSPTPSMTFSDPQSYKEALSKVVNAAVLTGHVIIVGRGAQVLTADRRDILHVRIVAPLEQRLTYVMQREGLDYNAARARVQLKDTDRHRFLQSQFRCHPDDSHLYDLVVNTGVLSLDDVVSMICQALQYKARKLSVATKELGPARGMEPYPGQPADFHMPEKKPDPPQ